MLEKAFAVARNAYERVTTAAAKAREALDAGAVFNEGSGPIAEANTNNVRISPVPGQAGNRADYLARRIARDRPDMLPAMAAGEYKSIHDADARAETVRVIAGQKDAFEEIRSVLAETAQGSRLRAGGWRSFKLSVAHLESSTPAVASVRLGFLHRPVDGKLLALCYPFAIRALCSPAATFS